MDIDILVVDDEKEIADLVELYIKSEGYNVHKFYNGQDTLDYLESNKPDLAILDVMLPDIGGFELCAQIRQKYNFPIIMLTAKIGDVDKITGLTIGADDYITKPFNPLEMIARVKAQLRRYTRYNDITEKEAKQEDIMDYAGLVMNKNTHKCSLYDETIVLTPIEFKILWLLCENSGKVISSEKIFQEVWGEKYLDSNNTVMVHIRRLREKLHEPPRAPRFIKTVWGVGYKFES